MSDDATKPDLFRSIAHRLAGDTASLPVEGHLASFDGATGWLNSEPLTPEGLRGRVVLVQFWTYTCINWLRTLPYARAWHAKYADRGLTIVGVHTPEFGFERDLENITRETRGFGVEYPVAIDSDYGIWTAFNNHFWPAIYLADGQGRLRYHHYGESEYAMTEMAIQTLLTEGGATDVDRGLVSVDPQGFEVAADWSTLRTPETYMSYGRSAGFASPVEQRFGEAYPYPAPSRLHLNEWALSGTWAIGPAAATLTEPNGRIAFRFQARDVNLVMGPATRGVPVPFRVLLDGQAPGAAGGFDLDGQGAGTVVDQRLYQLIHQTRRIEERTVEIEFLSDGIEAYCWTFG